MSFQMFLSDCLIPLFIQIIACPSDFFSTMGKIKKGNDLSWQPWWETEWHYYAPRLISAHFVLPIEKTEGHDSLSVSHLLIGGYAIEMPLKVTGGNMLIMKWYGLLIYKQVCPHSILGIYSIKNAPTMLYKTHS